MHVCVSKHPRGSNASESQEGVGREGGLPLWFTPGQTSSEYLTVQAWTSPGVPSSRWSGLRESDKLPRASYATSTQRLLFRFSSLFYSSSLMSPSVVIHIYIYTNFVSRSTSFFKREFCMYIDLLWNFNTFLVVIVFITDSFVFYYFRILDFYGCSLVNYRY